MKCHSGAGSRIVIAGPGGSLLGGGGGPLNGWMRMFSVISVGGIKRRWALDSGAFPNLLRALSLRCQPRCMRMLAALSMSGTRI